MELDERLSDLPDHVRETVDAISNLHDEHRRGGTQLQRLTARLAGAIATPAFAGLVSTVAASWIVLNLLLIRAARPPLDPPPFFWLQGAAGFTALLLTIVILTNQRREDQLSELRQQLILELAILGEQKTAKTLERLEALRRDLPEVRDSTDPAADALAIPADPAVVAEALKETRRDGGQG